MILSYYKRRLNIQQENIRRKIWKTFYKGIILLIIYLPLAYGYCCSGEQRGPWASCLEKYLYVFVYISIECVNNYNVSVIDAKFIKIFHDGGQHWPCRILILCLFYTKHISASVNCNWIINEDIYKLLINRST